MAASWKRPDHIPFPHTWHTFRARKPRANDDGLVGYRVQDLPPERIDDAIAHMCDFFLRDEPICRSLNMANNPVAVREISEVWRNVARQRCVVVCVREGSDEIVGLNMLTVVSRGDENSSQFESNAVRDFVCATRYMTDKGKLFDKHQVERFLSAWGLSVHPDYRGLGIATEILRVRSTICRAFGVRLSATVFSHPGSQIPAAKVGFRDAVVERFEDLATRGFNFPVSVEFNKLMTLTVDG